MSVPDVDLKNLLAGPGFFALKQRLLLFCDSMESIADLDLSKLSKVTLGEEIAGRVWAAKKVRGLLQELGVIDNFKRVKDRTFE